MSIIQLGSGAIIGAGQKPYIIAEVNSSHNGSLETAKQMILAAKEAGCSCVKFQSWSTESLYSKSYYDQNPIAKRIVDKFALSPDELLEASRYCKEVGIDFSSTPYSMEEADFLLDTCKASFIKVASMDITNYDYLAYIAKKGKPVFLSTGMADFQEIEDAVKILENNGCQQLVIFHCVSVYPAPADSVQLNNVKLLQTEFPQHVIGFSDHTLGTHVAAASIALGVAVVEKHFTLDNSRIGMDNNMAIEPEEMATLVEGCHAVYNSLGLCERVVSQEEIEQRKNMRRSVIAAVDLQAGDVLIKSHLSVKRPGTGIPANQLESLIGKVVLRDISADTLIHECDVK